MTLKKQWYVSSSCCWCVPTSGVVASCEQDTTSGFLYPDDMACGWCAEDAVLADDELLNAVCSTDLGDQLHDLGVPVASIAADNEGRALYAFWNGEENASYEGFAVVFLLEDLDLLSEAGAVER